MTVNWHNTQISVFSWELTYECFWQWKYRTTVVVEPICRVPGEFKVLLLILSYRNMGSPNFY